MSLLQCPNVAGDLCCPVKAGPPEPGWALPPPLPDFVTNMYKILSLKRPLIKFIYSDKATKFCEIFTLLLSYVVPVKSKVKISQNFVAFSEYMNFIWMIPYTYQQNIWAMRGGYVSANVSNYRTRAKITRSWFETALDYKTLILDPKIEEFPCLVV